MLRKFDQRTRNSHQYATKKTQLQLQQSRKAHLHQEVTGQKVNPPAFSKGYKFEYGSYLNGEIEHEN
jgi:hypothetical protein